MARPKVILGHKRADILSSYHHPWVFSKGLAHKPKIARGEQVRVVSQDGRHLGWAFFHPDNAIALRMISFGKDPVEKEDWRTRLAETYAMRRQVLPKDRKNFRLIHGENDGFPGLTIDIYGKLACMQVTCAAFDLFKDELAQWLTEITGVTAVYERSDGHARKQEGLPSQQGFLIGSIDFPMAIEENGFQQFVDPAGDQKTGLFLDQYHQRQWVESMAQGRNILDLFCYTGGFSMAASRGGAASITAVDSSTRALEQVKQGFENNNLDASKLTTKELNIFQMLKGEAEASYDLVILDPPSLAKAVKMAENARRTYRKLHRDICKWVKPGGILLTFSCTGVINSETFKQSVFLGLRDAQRDAQQLRSFDAGPDHPVHLCFPEGAYLKGLALYLR